MRWYYTNPYFEVYIAISKSKGYRLELPLYPILSVCLPIQSYGRDVSLCYDVPNRTHYNDDSDVIFHGRAFSWPDLY